MLTEELNILQFMLERKNPKWEVILEHNLHQCVAIYICASKARVKSSIAAVDLAVAANLLANFFIDCCGVM